VEVEATTLSPWRRQPTRNKPRHSPACCDHIDRDRQHWSTKVQKCSPADRG